jgi:hypothetical protein
MRVLFGIILVCALTIGGAYLADHASAAPPDLPERMMVNWDVVAKNVDALTTTARDGLKKLQDYFTTRP